MLKYILPLLLLIISSNKCVSQGKLFSSSILDSAYFEASAGKTISMLPLSDFQAGDVDFNLIFGTNIGRYDFFASAGLNKFKDIKSFLPPGSSIIQDDNIFNFSMGIKYKVPLGNGFEFSLQFSLGIYPYKVYRILGAYNIQTKSVTPLGFSLGISTVKRIASPVALTITTKYNHILNSDEIKFFQIDAGIRVYP